MPYDRRVSSNSSVSFISVAVGRARLIGDVTPNSFGAPATVCTPGAVGGTVDVGEETAEPVDSGPPGRHLAATRVASELEGEETEPPGGLWETEY